MRPLRSALALGFVVATVVLLASPGAAGPLLRPVTAETIFRGFVPAGLPDYRVIDDGAEFAEFFDGIGRPAPAVDFGKKVVLVAVSGTRTEFCGYGITAVQSSDLFAAPKPLVATVVHGASNFAPLGLCLQVVGNFAHLAAVDRARGVALFQDQATLAPLGADAIA